MSVERNASYNRSEHGDTELENYTLVNRENYTEKKKKKNWPLFSSCNPFPSKPSSAKDNISFCALYRLLLAKPKHFNVSYDVFFLGGGGGGAFKVRSGGTVPLK